MSERSLQTLIKTCLILGTFCLTPPGQATETSTTLAEHASLSDHVVFAKVLQSEAREDSQTGLIFTYTDFEILTALTGDLDTSFSTRVIGGRVGEREISSPMLEPLVVDREYVLFLGEPNMAGYYTISPAGILQVFENAVGNKIVKGPLNLPLFREENGQPYANRSSSIPLEDFLFSVRLIIESK